MNMPFVTHTHTISACHRHEELAATARPSTIQLSGFKTRFKTSLKGIDFDAIAEDDECDFLANDNFSKNANNCQLPESNPIITPEEVVNTCMNYLQTNNEPKPNSGLEVCYNFSSDACRASNGGSLESFLQRNEYNPVFQTMVDCQQWQVLSVGPEIQGTNTRGAMKTVLVKVVQKHEGGGGARKNDRTFLWTMMKERRPPRQGYWLVHECISVENAFALTL